MTLPLAQKLKALIAAASELLDQKQSEGLTWEQYRIEVDRLQASMTDNISAAAAYQQILRLELPTAPPLRSDAPAPRYRDITPDEAYLGMMTGVELGIDPEIDAAVDAFTRTGALPDTVAALEAVEKFVRHYCPVGANAEPVALSPLQARWAQHLAQTLGLPPYEFQRRLRQPAAVLAPVLGVDVSAFEPPPPPSPAENVPTARQLSAPDLGPHLHHAPELGYLRHAGIPIPDSSGPVIPAPPGRPASSWIDELERLEDMGIDVQLGSLL